MHPFHQFLYCPQCGAKRFVVRNEKAKACEACGFVYYFNPSAAVACFITNSKGEILLTKRAKEPAKGTLDLPGGFVDMYETAEDAVRREVLEETSLALPNSTYMCSLPNLYVYSGFEVHTVVLFFRTKMDDFAGAKAADDAAELVVLPLSKLNPADFGLLSIRKAIALFIAQTNEQQDDKLPI